MRHTNYIRLSCAIIMFICSLYGCVLAQNSKLAATKIPLWVTATTNLVTDHLPEAEAEDGYLFLDYEMQVSVMAHSRYYKKVIKILSDAGVQNQSEISVSFDPQYEKLKFHSITITREGEVINKLQLSNFKVIQQEKELSMHLYDGSLTALLELDDVRKGDIIESSYTVEGFNPIFNDKYADVYELGYGVPVQSVYYKLIIPHDRKIIFKNRETTIAPLITKAGSEDIYEWKTTAIKAIHIEDKTPEWYNPYPRVTASEFSNWKDVSTWSYTLYPKNIKLSGMLQQKIKEIKDTYRSPENRALAAIHFVQDNVRYMGIEIGENSHRPNNPNKIFQQRFGDCKDKSYLLVTMLNAMNITANPVLINTTAKDKIKEVLPSALCFDHCTVQVLLNNKTIWIDPTIPFQNGDIYHLSYPDYKAGLVITPTTTDLTNIPFSDEGLSNVQETFRIPDMSGKAYLKVVTTSTGSMADDTRSDYKNNSLYEMKNRYKDFYAHFFDKIIADSLTYSNNDSTNTFTTTEYYTLDSLWKIENGKKKFLISSFIINSIMSKPADKNRKMPFAINYPAHYQENIEADMPDDWPITPFNQQTTCEGFRFSANAIGVKNTVLLNYEYEALKDNITANEAADYFKKYKEVDDGTNFSLYSDVEASTNYASTRKSLSSQDDDLFPKLYTGLGILVVITMVVKRKGGNLFRKR